MAATVDCQEETSGNIYYLKKPKNSFLTEIAFVIYKSWKEKGFILFEILKEGGTHGGFLH